MNPKAPYAIKITEQPISDKDGRTFVSGSSHGAVVVFHGVTRDHTDSRQVLFLEYEAYLPMAQKKLEKVAKETCENWDVKTHIQHRLGRVDIGEASLIVAVGSPHRKEAFDACVYSVDMIKEEVTIWKKEYFNGGEVWIGDAEGFRPLEHAKTT
jgi:molybdopterin synthase catalytic subunit